MGQGEPLADGLAGIDSANSIVIICICIGYPTVSLGKVRVKAQADDKSLVRIPNKGSLVTIGF